MIRVVFECIFYDRHAPPKRICNAIVAGEKEIPDPLVKAFHLLGRGRERKKERYRQPEKAQGPPIRAAVRSHVSRPLIPNCSRVAAVAFQNLAQVGGMALEGTLSPCRNTDKGSFSIIVNIDKCHQNRLRIKPVARN